MIIYSISQKANKNLCELFNIEWDSNYQSQPLDMNTEIVSTGGYFNVSGMKQSPEHIHARSEALKGKCGRPGHKKTPETIEKMRQWALKSNSNPETIRKRSEEKNHLKISYVVIDPNGDSFQILGINSFCKENNLSHSAMICVAQGKRKHHKNWKCYYKL
jgi:hypothetical protein